MFGMKKLMKDLNVIEKIALMLSILYGLGVASLLQFNALFIGGECLDFLRIKPILVGIQYVIYLLLPAIVACVPVYYLKHSKGRSWWLKGLVALFFVALALLIPSIMFHYFIPFTYDDTAGDELCFYWKVPLQFWSMFFYWDPFHVMGMLLTASFFLMFVCKRKGVPQKLLIGWLLLAMVWNMFFFNRDMYVNIVQSAGGGAPRAGIITIANPTEMMKRANMNYMTDENEISKPCFILEEGDDYFIIAEMFGNYPNRRILSETDIRASATRVVRDSVKQFSPINFHLGFTDWSSVKYCKNLKWDIVHQLDVVLNLVYTPTSSGVKDIWDVPEVGMRTNDVVLSWWADHGGMVSARGHEIEVGPVGTTNLLMQVKFSGVKYPRGIYIWSLEDQLKEANTHVRISNLPPSPMGFKYHHAQLIFTCNFVYDIQHVWEGVFTRNGSLLIKSRAACDAEAPARNPNDFEKGEL